MMRTPSVASTIRSASRSVSSATRWLEDTVAQAITAFDHFLKTYGAKYPDTSTIASRVRSANSRYCPVPVFNPTTNELDST